MVDVAKLVFEFDATSATAAERQIDSLEKASDRLDQTAKRTRATFSGGAYEQATRSAGAYEQSVRSLIGAYEQGRDALGRFTGADGAFQMSQAATARLLLQNAKAAEALAKEQDAAARAVQRLTSSYDPLAGAVLKTNNEIARADGLFARGKISAEQYATVVSGLKGKLETLDQAQVGLDKTSNTLRYTTLNLGRQFSDIGVQLAGGQNPFMILVQQGPQVADAFATASASGLGFKAVMRGVVAEARAMLVTFGPWIAGLAAVGGAVWYVVNAHKEQAKAVDDTTKRLEEQRKALGQISPLLSQAKNDADLAADGQRNYDEWIRKTNVSLAEQIRLQRAKTLNDTNEAALKAGEELRKAQEQFDKLNKPGARVGFSTGVGGFSTISAATNANKESELYQKAAANLKRAREDADAVQRRLAQQGQAPDIAFSKQAESATVATKAIRSNSDALRGNAVALSGLGDDALSFVRALEEQNSQAGMSAEQLKRLEIQTAILLAPTDELRERLIKAADAWETQVKFAKDAAAAQKEVAKQQGEAIRTIDNANVGLEDHKRSLEEVSWAYERAFRSAGDFFGAVASGDVGGSIGGLSNLLKDASGLASGGLSKALGKAGAFLGPVGEAVSAVTGVLGIIGQKSAEAAQRKLDALNRGVEDLRASNMASSDSIKGALDEANKLWNADLEYSNAMVTSLRSIDSQISSLAVAVSNSITTGNLLSTSGLGLGTSGSGAGGLLGAVGAMLFGNTKTSTSLLDQGLAFNPGTYAQGVTGSTYADLATTKTKSLLGVAYSTKVSNSTVSGALSGDLLSQVNAVIKALGDGVLSAASVFGSEAAKAAESALGSAVVDLGKLSLKDLKPDEIAAVLQATFDKVGDQLAAAGVPGLDKLGQVGEGAFETLTRVAREYQVVDVALASIGKTFGAVGLESLAARDGLVQLLGGLDSFSSKNSFFAANFLTDAERLAPIQKAVNDNLAAYGLSASSTRDQFKSLVLAQDLTTESGRNTYAALLNIAPAFDKVATAAETTAATIKAAEDAKAAKQAEIVNAQASVQDRIDAITKTSAELLYLGREKELKAADALDASLGPMLLKLWEFEDAATKTAEATAKATAAEAEREEAIQKSLANQATNIGLMRQLMAMDDAVLGTTSARDAARADELAKLDATGKYLQQIVWARQDEADRIAKQNEAMAKAAELLKQRTDLENQLLVALGMSSLATERQRDAILKGLDPSLRGMQSLLWGVEDSTAAVTAAEQALTEARSAASQAYEREASAIQQTIDKFKSFSSSLRGFRSSLETGGLAMNDPLQQYARTKADFERVAGLAASGNEEALGSLQGVSEAYLEAAKNAQSTNVGYFKDLSAVKRATEAAQKYADQQVDQGTAQLSALNAQVSALGILNQSTLSVGQAVTNVAAAIDALARATSAKSAADAAARNALANGGVIPKPAGAPLNDQSRQVLVGANDNASLAAAKVYYNSANGGVDKALFDRYFANDMFGKSVGYTGDPEELRKRYGFATGGSFTVGGSGPPDSQVFPLHLSPGEMVNVSRPGQGGNAELVAELRALRQEVADLKAHTKRGADAAEDSATVLEGAAKGQLAITTEAA